MSEWLYVAACVLGPAAWGTLMYFLYNWVDKRRRRVKREDAPPIDYSI